MDDIIVAIAGATTNLAAQRAAANVNADACAAVLANEHCDEALWIERYRTTGPGKISTAAAKGAVSHRVSDRQMTHLLSVEKRAAVIAAALCNTMPAWDQLSSEPLVGFLSAQTVAKALTDAWEPLIDPDTLARIDAAKLHAKLRAWRLSAPSLTDDEIVTELNTFDDWAQYYNQLPVSWAIHRRPHLVARLVECPSIPVRTQIASSPNLGRLDLDQQRRLLELHDLPDAEQRAFYNDRVAMWWAAVGNPTLHMELVDALAKCAIRQDREPGFYDSVENRRKYAPWTVPDLCSEVDENQLTRLFRWTLPSMSKGRPSAFIQLVENPSLGVNEAASIADRFAGSGQLARVTWYHPDVRAAMARLEERFPTVATEYGPVARWDEMLADSGLASAVTRAGIRTYPDPEPPTRWGDPDTAGDRNVSALRSADATLTYLESRLGENEEAWTMLFTILPQMADATVAQLADMCEAVLA